MKDDCYSWRCQNVPTTWLRIKWVKSGTVDMIHYCSEHADKIQRGLTKLNLAEVTQSAEKS